MAQCSQVTPKVDSSARLTGLSGFWNASVAALGILFAIVAAIDRGCQAEVQGCVFDHPAGRASHPTIATTEACASAIRSCFNAPAGRLRVETPHRSISHDGPTMQ